MFAIFSLGLPEMVILLAVAALTLIPVIAVILVLSRVWKSDREN